MKKRTKSHLIDSEGTDLLKSVLPNEWVVRPYQPDYGIDFAVEIFDKQGEHFVTMGEHFFIQLKSSSNVSKISKRVHPRYNIEKSPLTLDKEKVKNIDVISISLERQELELARSMGPAVPLLLVVADVKNSEVYWVCLNDFVDKVILPEKPNFLNQASHTVHIPLHNQVKNTQRDLMPLRFYARRAKLYAAFNRFRYQRHEIQYAHDNLSTINYCGIETSELLSMAKHFLGIVLAYDFWTTTYAWPAVELIHNRTLKTEELVRRVLDGEDMKVIMSGYYDMKHDTNLLPFLLATEITSTFNNLANLGNMFEEICREWFLPTYLGQLSEEHSL
jgi:hypothetical protein